MNAEKTNRRLYRNDIILAAIVCAAALFTYCIIASGFGRNAQKNDICVTVDAKTVATLSLQKNGVYSYLDGKFVLEIKDGTARVAKSECPDGDCKGMKITSKGGQIVCLPNKIMVYAVEPSQKTDVRIG